MKFTRRVCLGIIPGTVLGAIGLAVPRPASAIGSMGLPTQVIGAIQAICHVTPDFTAILALIAAFGAGATAVSIAQAFCAALGNGSSAKQLVVRRAGLVYANGHWSPGGAVMVRGVVVPFHDDH